MKRALFTSFIAIILTSCSSQSKTMKLYGYKQAISPGKPTGYETDEVGQPIPSRNKVRTNYFVYITHPAKLKLEPLELWIKGDQFGLRKENVSSPVEFRYDDGPFETGKELLVPKTTDSVWLLVPIEKAPGKSLLPENELVETHELVLVYKKNNRTHTQTLKTLKSLRTAVMQ